MISMTIVDHAANLKSEREEFLQQIAILFTQSHRRVLEYSHKVEIGWSPLKPRPTWKMDYHHHWNVSLCGLIRRTWIVKLSTGHKDKHNFAKCHCSIKICNPVSLGQYNHVTDSHQISNTAFAWRFSPVLRNVV